MSLVGRHIGRYRILEQLGQGGMSVVYKGLDTALDREVAVKVLHAHLAGKEESRRRLAREAKAVARLNHPNILEIFDFASADSDQAYLVTEYIRGHTLRQLADTVGFDPPEIGAMVIHEVASALAQAHEAGIIHRDLKPENVMVREDGVVKLMDFGIAKIIDRDDKMTMTGALVGSPAHMAPEIIEGEDAGAEADVFSLGTMLYLLATGRLPFTASNTTATLKRILDGVYDDPRQLVPTLSDELAEIIATCLARQPSSRYPTARKLQVALHEYLDALGLGRTAEELQSFFADAAAYRRALVPRMVDALIRKSEAFIAEKRPARALAALNQLLALDPGNARALSLLEHMNAARRRQRLAKRWARIGLVAGVSAIVVAAGASVAVWAARRADAPAPTAPPVATLPSTASPERPAVAEPEPRPTTLEPPPSAEPSPTTAPERPRVAREMRNPARPAEHVRPASAGARVPLVVKLRPYGFLELPGQPRTAELAQHAIELPPGTHDVKVGCTYCEPVTERITVRSDERREYHWAVQALPSRIAFDFEPRQAVVRVRGQQKSAAESLARPFELRTARGSSDLRHRVDYEVSHPGYVTQRATVTVAPGETQILKGSLSPE